MHTFTPIVVVAALATVASAMKYHPRGYYYPFNTTTTETPCPTAITTTYTTCYTTSYSSICDDGLCPHTYTITEYCTSGPCDIPPETTYIPPGFTTTVTECDNCGPEYSTVTITCPITTTTTSPPYPSTTCDSEECCDGDDCYETSANPPQSSQTGPPGPGWCCSGDGMDCWQSEECSNYPGPTSTCPGGGVCPSKTDDYCGGGECPEETGGCGGGDCPEETDEGCGGAYCPSSTGEEPPMFTGGAMPAHRRCMGSAVVIGAVAAVAFLL